MNHQRIILTYETYADNEKGIHELLEKITAEHPLQIITGMGQALDALEKNISALSTGEKFDFTLSVDDGYGPYMEEHVLQLPKDIFCIDGRFDKAHVYPGAVLPFNNSDGLQMLGTVMEVREQDVRVDFNHPWAGKSLHFKGEILEARPATDEEITGYLNMLSGGGCSCCGGHEGGCGGHEGGCGNHGGGCGNHEGGCGGGGHDHKHDGGGCCGHHH